MERLGVYQCDGKEYDCVYYPARRIAEAIGPLPVGNSVGSFKVVADSIRHARQKLAQGIGSGRWT